MTTTANKPRPVRVLIVDDSAVVRSILKREIERDPALQVVGTAPDPYVARDLIVELQPDVLTLDVEMPRMDGITFLRKLMAARPMPVIVLSSLTAAGTQTAMDALSVGAIDVLAKPDSQYSVRDVGELLVERIKVAARARVAALPQASTEHTGAATSGVPAAKQPGLSVTTDQVIALGASTGGVAALSSILTALPAMCPGVLIVQHMPPRFSTSFAERMNSISRVRVKEACSGDSVVTGHVLIAPGNRHMTLHRSGARYYVELNDGPAVHHQRPSVDVLFDSVAASAGSNAVGAILTGMGADGAAGLLKMRQAGAWTIAQDQATCVVFGMPLEAIKMQAASEVKPLGEIPGALLAAVSRNPVAGRLLRPSA